MTNEELILKEEQGSAKILDVGKGKLRLHDRRGYNTFYLREARFSNG